MSVLATKKGGYTLKRLFRSFLIFAALGLSLGASAASAAARTATHPFDRFFVIMMENQSFDNVIGRHSAFAQDPDTPYITSLALANGFSTLSFGVTHPSLPNYVALISGKIGANNDDPSCFAQPKPTGSCNKYGWPTLVDSLENKGISWSGYFQMMPSAGYLGTQFPSSVPLYAQKHNPFVYFFNIANNVSRLAKLKPITQLSSDLALGASAPQFEFIVPDQCHDMHGQAPCGNFDNLLKMGDAEVQKLVTKIEASPAFTTNSVIFVTWDEDDYSSILGCCDSPPALGGGHIATIVISGTPGGPLNSSTYYNEYSILSTLENAWGLPLLGATADTANVHPMFDLIH